MSQLWEMVYNLIATLSPGIKFLIAGAIVLIGIGFVIPAKKAKEWSKEQIFYVIVGAVLWLEDWHLLSTSRQPLTLAE